ncbi:chloride channel protein [Streptococcus iniae]|nr:chloride channel protein [Streptococcus iniae]
METVPELAIKDKLVLCAYGLFIGFLVGVMDYIFGSGLLLISAFRDKHIAYLLPFLAVIGLVIVFCYQKYGKIASKGMALVFEVGQNKRKDLPLILIPLIMISTWLSHLFGASAGREGVAVQIGATLSNAFKGFFKFEGASSMMAVIGMATGFAGLFQTPIATLLFALEVLVLNKLYLTALLPSLIAAFTASYTSHFLGLEKFHAILDSQLELTPILFAKLLLLGLIFGLVGNAFAILLTQTKQKFAAKMTNPYYRIFLVSLFLTVSLLVAHWGRYSGLGTNVIQAAFSGGEIYTYDWLLKLLLTVVTLAAGFQGGEVTPLFAIGASLGVVLAPVFGLPVMLVVALGYTSVFASATNTFLAPVFIGVEVFGPDYIWAYLIVVALAYNLNKKESIYANKEA